MANLITLSLLSQKKDSTSQIALHKQIEDILFSDPEKALSLAKKELKKSKKGTIEYVDALNDIGVSSYYLDDYDSGLKYLNDALNEAVILNYNKGEADALFYLGDIHILLGKYGTAIDYLAKSLDIYTKLKDNSGMADCMNGIGNIQMYQGNFEKAKDYFEKALKYGDNFNKADSYTYLGDLYVKIEAYDEAIKYAEKSLQLGKQNNDNYVISASLDNLGYAYMMTKRERKALGLLN
ncbi:MAG: hypothetical protein Kow0068_26300 [Marinilabiliales bacterium]